MARAEDEENLQKAGELGRIFITRDKDYGNLVFVRMLRVGVLYLRMLPSNRDAVHLELKRILEDYTEEELRTAFVVVEAGRLRFRRI
jgi:predicted nuclease of predicted toxin-antitoxin system